MAGGLGWRALRQFLKAPPNAVLGQDAFVFIGAPPLPPPLDTYPFHGTLANAAIIFQSATVGNYTFMVAVHDTFDGVENWYIGKVKGGAVQEISPGSTVADGIRYGDDGTHGLIRVFTNVIILGASGITDLIQFTTTDLGDIGANGYSLPQGIVGTQGCAPNPGAVVAQTAGGALEVNIAAAAYTGGQQTFDIRTDRLVRLTLQAGVFGTVANRATVRLRRQGTGLELGAFLQPLVSGGSLVEYRTYQTFVKNVSGATVSVPIDISIQRSAGAGNVGLYAEFTAGLNAPVILTAEDMGSVTFSPYLSRIAQLCVAIT